MKKNIPGTLILTFFFVILFSGFTPILATSDSETESGDVVCPPDVYQQSPDDCEVFGPAARLTELAKQGIPYPLPPVPSYSPDPTLAQVPYMYFKTDETGMPLYGSLDVAQTGKGWSRYIDPGFVYLTYIQRAETDRGVFYMLPSGEWYPGKGSRIGYSTFQGLLLSSTPQTAFGWSIAEQDIRSAPGYNAPTTGKKLNRFDFLQVFAVQAADDTDWVLIGPDEWIEDRLVGRVSLASAPPDGVDNNRWIEVNLEEQTLAVYENGKLIFATLISTGLEPFWTQPGLFKIYQKKATEDMTGSFEADHSDYYFLEKVPWTMYFDQARALHGAYWHTYFGYPQSHGCVNLSVGDSRWLYDWAKEGDWVYVHDPSGKTPTDPAYYGAGAP
jgi:hypothetical protein